MPKAYIFDAVRTPRGRGKKAGLKPRARIRAWANVGVEPSMMLHGPWPASQKALKNAGMKISDIDLCEMNEAFASPTLHLIRKSGLSPEQVNVNGGAIALGHPLGATDVLNLESNQAFADTYPGGERFLPPETLRTMAQKGGKFYALSS